MTYVKMWLFKFTMVCDIFLAQTVVLKHRTFLVKESALDASQVNWVDAICELRTEELNAVFCNNAKGGIEILP